MTALPRTGEGQTLAPQRRAAPHRSLQGERPLVPLQPGPAQLLGVLAAFMTLLMLCGLLASRF